MTQAGLKPGVSAFVCVCLIYTHMCEEHLSKAWRLQTYLLPFMDGDAKARGTEASYRFYNILSGCPKDTQGLQELSETYSLPLIPGIAGPLRADCLSSPGTVIPDGKVAPWSRSNQPAPENQLQAIKTSSDCVVGPDLR